MNYKELIIKLLEKINDEKVLKRTYYIINRILVRGR